MKEAGRGQCQRGRYDQHDRAQGSHPAMLGPSATARTVPKDLRNNSVAGAAVTIYRDQSSPQAVGTT